MAARSEEKRQHGGARRGAGRKRKAVSPTALADVDLRAARAQDVPDDIETLAEGNARTSIDTMVKVIIAGTSDATRVIACNKILDRGFGKPAVDVGGGTLDLFGGTAARKAGHEIRDYARRFAPLAIAALQKIRDNSASEAARVAAGASLLDRELGTVAVAKVPELRIEKPLGKKEEAQRSAEARATGVYAPPPPPATEHSRLQ